jgi:hypothetical protein
MVDCEGPVLGQAGEELFCLIVEVAADWIQGGIKRLSPYMKIKQVMNQHNLWTKELWNSTLQNDIFLDRKSHQWNGKR